MEQPPGVTPYLPLTVLEEASVPSEETRPLAGATEDHQPPTGEPRATPSGVRGELSVSHQLLNSINAHWWLFAVAAVVILIIVVPLIAVKRVPGPYKPAPANDVNNTAEDKDRLTPCQCEDGWFLYDNKCFFFSEDEGNWTFANNTCASLNTSLAVIKSNAEKDVAISKRGDRNRWVGLRKGLDEKWTWIDGVIYPNGTDIPGGSACAYLNHKDYSSGRCQLSLRYICTKPAH